MSALGSYVTALVAAAAFTLGGAACSGKGKGDKPDPAAVAVDHAPIVMAYEALRDRLAHDDLAGGKTAGEAVAKVAQGLDGAIQTAAADVAKASDIAVARHAFGELSKAYITMLAAKPDLAKGLYTFRCPMAEGYQKWVQVDAELKNPYMGSKMLECGSKVALAP